MGIMNMGMPKNEHMFSYAPGCGERAKIEEAIKTMENEKIDIPLIIGGKEIRTGNTGTCVMPHDHKHVLATYHMAGKEEVAQAIEASLKAKRDWERMPWEDRAAICMRAAELISKKYRYIMNASTMLGQSKSVFQAEIDAACESIDFLRLNAYFMQEIYKMQPLSEEGMINRLEYRPLEGFIFAVTPFNFTAIGANLPTSCAMMGNTVVWKPATTSLLSNYYLMKIFMEAGFPAGVINFVPGPGSKVGGMVLPHKELAGIHFTGSTGVFNNMWKTVGDNIDSYKSYPRLIGETGGKDFVMVHPTADADMVATALVRGAFEYQGQKCSAASRTYIPKSLWPAIKDRIGAFLGEITMGDTRDMSNFVNAVIDEKAFDSIMGYINAARNTNDAQIVFGGKGDKSVGYFIEPTLIEAKDPHFLTMEEEIFGPVLTAYVYDDNKFEETLQICNETSPYALTGAIIANDRQAVLKAFNELRFAAGNFYINDKPTGAVVGQQPFGGARKSGTNDKAGSYLNLLRWTSPRTIKENLNAPTHYAYEFLKRDEYHSNRKDK